MDRKINRFIGRLLLFSLLSTVLTACGASKDIRELAVKLDTEFSGELEDVQVEDIFLTWSSKKLGGDERFEVVIDFGNIGEGLTTKQTIEANDLNLQVNGSRHEWRLRSEWSENTTYFPLFAEAKSGTEIPISISRIDGRDEVVSRSQFKWIRPNKVSAPQSPTLNVKWIDSGDNFYRWSLQGNFNLTFDSYPDSYKLDCAPKENCGYPDYGLIPRFGIAFNNFAFAANPQPHEIEGTNVKGVGKTLSFSFTAINDIGSSEMARVDTISGGPSRSTTSPQRQSNPFDRTWKSSEKDLEALAKTAWCIENGYRDYIWSKDICTNELSR
jgi:predicted small secreted protein